MADTTQRTRVRGVVAVALALGLVGLAPVVGAAPAAAAAGLSVSKGSALLDDEVIQVSLSGLVTGATYRLAQCGGPDPAVDCADWYSVISGQFGAPARPSNVAYPQAQANGAVSVPLQVERAFTVWRGTVIQGDPPQGEPGTEVDCTVAACTLQVFEEDGQTALATVGLSFTADGTWTWPASSLVVSDTTVVEDQQVQVAVSGLSPWFAFYFAHDGVHAAWVDICVGADPVAGDCELGDVVTFAGQRLDRYLEPTPVGTAFGRIRVPRHLEVAGGPVDCAEVQCTIGITQGTETESNRVPITFRPDWAPWSSTTTFADEVGFVRGRALTAAERADVVARIGDGSTEGPDLLLEAAEAAAFDPASSTYPVAEVTRTYRAFFGRGADSGGLFYWRGRLTQGLTVTEMSRTFGSTPEFRSVYGSASNSTVVRRAYQNTLGRTPAAGEEAYWVGRLQAGLARWKLIHQFSRSPEFRTRETDRVAITLVVFTVAGRAPDAQELAGSPVDIAGSTASPHRAIAVVVADLASTR